MDEPLDCRTADGLEVAVRALKLEIHDITTKEIHAALEEAAGEAIDLSAVKRAASKVTKALAREASLLPPPPPPPPVAPTPKMPAATPSMPARREQAELRALAPTAEGRPIPPLVAPPVDSVAFLRCHVCRQPVRDAKVCSGCRAVCYCTPVCQAADGGHADECASLKAHMSTRYRVQLEPEPEWLGRAMDHRCEMTSCELLASIGCHSEECYQLICGCAMPRATHCYLVDGAPSDEQQAEQQAEKEAACAGSTPASAHVSTWAEYYERRREWIPLDSPLALLLTWPLTVYYALCRLGLADLPTAREVAVHYLGPEKEVLLLPLFAELASLCPASTICITMVGPLSIALPAPISFHGKRGGRVSVSVVKGLYHQLHLPEPDLAIAPNAGLAVSGYRERWPPTLRHIERKGIPFLFSDYSEQSIEKGLATARVVSETLARVQGKEGLPAALGGAMEPSTGVLLNPFRAPMRLPRVDDGSVGHPTLSNGWFACFNTPPGAFDAAAAGAGHDVVPSNV